MEKIRAKFKQRYANLPAGGRTKNRVWHLSYGAISRDSAFMAIQKRTSNPLNLLQEA